VKEDVKDLAKDAKREVKKGAEEFKEGVKDTAKSAKR